MEQYRIALIPGDGIGKEVTQEGRRILDTVAFLDKSFSFLYQEFPWGCDYYLQHGRMMEEDGLEQLKAFDAILLGAVGDPRVPDHLSLRDLLLRIRQGFDQYVNLRPVVLLKGAPCRIKDIRQQDVNITFIRENSEGEYAGLGGFYDQGLPSERAEQVAVFSRKGTERIIRYAYALAEKTGQTLTSITKGNALNYSMVYWDRLFREIGKEYPSVETHQYMVDAAAMFLIQDPKRFQVVVTSNLFGDILTDLGTVLAGGMGLAAGANLNPEKRFPSMFEPIHGSAPDIAGQQKANPLATIWAASQLLDHLGYTEWGKKVLSAISYVLQEKRALTPDLHGSASTEECGKAVAQALLTLA